MPLVVIDVRERIAKDGGDFTVGVEDLQHFERCHGRIPRGGCVLLLTGFARLYFRPTRPGPANDYSDPAPGLDGNAVTWLFDKRSIKATGSDTFGPDATSDEDFSATSITLAKGGITVENVGPGLRGDAPVRRLGVDQRRPAPLLRLSDGDHGLHQALTRWGVGTAAAAGAVHRPVGRGRQVPHCKRRGVQEALNVVATQVGQPRGLLRLLHALGDDRDPEPACHVDRAVADRLRARPASATPATRARSSLRMSTGSRSRWLRLL